MQRGLGPGPPCPRLTWAVRPTAKPPRYINWWLLFFAGRRGGRGGGGAGAGWEAGALPRRRDKKGNRRPEKAAGCMG